MNGKDAIMNLKNFVGCAIILVSIRGAFAFITIDDGDCVGPMPCTWHPVVSKICDNYGRSSKWAVANFLSKIPINCNVWKVPVAKPSACDCAMATIPINDFRGRREVPNLPFPKTDDA